MGSFEGFKHLRVIDRETIDEQRLKWLWDHANTQDYAFDDFSRGKVEWFLFQLADHNVEYLEIGDSGLFIIQNPMQGGDAGIHFIVWDRNFSLHSNKAPAYELLDYLFYKVGVHRVSGRIPVYNRLAPRFALAMGMKFEGELQEAVLWHGKYHNVQMYGLLERQYRERKERIVQ